MRKVVVNDTNVFIDLLCIGLLDEFFSLSWEIHTTDFVMHELIKEGQKEIVEQYSLDGKLHVANFSSDEVFEILGLLRQHQAKTKVSMTDCSVWYYAKKNRYELLTGDRKLRSSSLRDGVEVHGILYVFDALVQENIISQDLATERIEILKKSNVRLPKDEIDKRLNAWGNDKNKKGGCL